jgi:hypothetical protein
MVVTTKNDISCIQYKYSVMFVSLKAPVHEISGRGFCLRHPSLSGLMTPKTENSQFLPERLLTRAFKVCLREFLKSIWLTPGKIDRLFKWKLSTR